MGAKAAAKTVAAAVDAATAPNPTPVRRSAGPTNALPRQRGTDLPSISNSSARPAAAAAQTGRAAGAATRSTARGLGEGTKRFGREVWNPFVRLSGVLWLEFTGVFFGLFALFALGAAWKLRGAWRLTETNATEHQRLWGALAMLAVFAYFCLSSFIRAARRGRRRN